MVTRIKKRTDLKTLAVRTWGKQRKPYVWHTGQPPDQSVSASQFVFQWRQPHMVELEDQDLKIEIKSFSVHICNLATVPHSYIEKADRRIYIYKKKIAAWSFGTFAEFRCANHPQGIRQFHENCKIAKCQTVPHWCQFNPYGQSFFPKCISARNGHDQKIANATTLDLFKSKWHHYTPRQSINKHICEIILRIKQQESEP